MNITAELSLYPLTDDYVPIIRSYIEVLNKVDGLEVRTHALVQRYWQISTGNGDDSKSNRNGF